MSTEVYVQISELQDDQFILNENVYQIHHSHPQILGQFGGWGRENVKLLKDSVFSKICHDHFFVKRTVNLEKSGS